MNHLEWSNNLSVHYSPQQNGVSEGKSKTIMEMLRYLLEEKYLPKKFWAEATITNVVLLIRKPMLAVEEKIPFEAWYGVKPVLE